MRHLFTEFVSYNLKLAKDYDNEPYHCEIFTFSNFYFYLFYFIVRSSLIKVNFSCCVVGKMFNVHVSLSIFLNKNMRRMQ